MRTFKDFRARAAAAIADQRLQAALENATGRFREGRETALADVADVDLLRDQLKSIRAAAVANLAEHLETFEKNAKKAGVQVHWAEDGSQAAQIVAEIAETNGVKLIAKSKSMATEEIHLNHVLEGKGIQPVETDLGEWIIQLAEEPPSHIIAPAIHKTKEQVADLFEAESGRDVPADISELTLEARRMLRERFLEAGMGISGVNLAVAESGSLVLVTNEGNGRMVTSLPRVHVAVMGIEKVAPRWQDAVVWLSLLARSATGQPLSIYTSIITGPARADDPDGPEEVHVVLLDNRRSEYLGTKYEEVLQCIRCGACLNICPVYREAGGHAYGSPYSGPIGAVINPLLFGLEEYSALPQASSLCGACLDVCPVRIDLPRMLLALRADQVQTRILPWQERIAEKSAAKVLASPGLYTFFAKVGRWALKPFTRNKKFKLPGMEPYPALPEKSFRELWAEMEEKE